MKNQGDFCVHQPIFQINNQFWAPVEPWF